MTSSKAGRITNALTDAIEDVIMACEKAALFQDGVEADLYNIGVDTIAKAYMQGRMDAFAELRDQLNLPARQP
jgi:hypothetical protein